MIKELLENMSYVNLFTRPRRFGKTLTMSMLKNFFEVDSDSTLFDGLEISKEEELCKEYMGKFPVISISLKNVAGDTFDTAKRRLRSTLAMEAGRFPFLANSGRLSEGERQQYAKLIALDNKGEFTMTDTLMENSLLMLNVLYVCCGAAAGVRARRDPRRAGRRCPRRRHRARTARGRPA